MALLNLINRVSVSSKHCLFVPVTYRGFTTSTLLLKKGGKQSKKSNGKSNIEEDILLEEPGFYTKKYRELQDKEFKFLEKKFQVRKQALEFNPQLLEELNVGKDSKFKDLATATKKGRVMIITCFDKKNVNTIINTILAKNDLLKMTPEKIPDNEQQVKINLPPVTDAVKKEFANSLKTLGESFKKELKTDFLNKGEMKIVKELNKKKDALALGIMKEFEKDHKTFTTKVDDMVKKYLK
ncbi:hypothetical protein QEN19_001589 [Hanseniaspora menglaensis]